MRSRFGGRAELSRWLTLAVLAGANLALLSLILGRHTPLTDVFAPLAGHIVGIGAAAAVALLLHRGRLTIMAAGTTATLALHAWLGLAPCCQPAPPAADAVMKVSATAVDRGITVLSLNAWHHNSDLGRLETYLAASPADVVVLSEFGPDKRTLLARLKPIYPHQVECADRWACSLALISRHPIEAGGTALAAGDMPAFAWARLAGQFTVIGTHLHRPSRDPWLHERQALALGRFAGRIDGAVVLVGDLNSSPWSAAYRNLRRAAGLRAASGLTPTWPAWPVALPQVALDHVLVSVDIAVTASGTGPAVGSDHLPVWARLEAPHGRFRQAPARALRLAAAGAHLGGELLADLGREHGGARDLRR